MSDPKNKKSKYKAMGPKTLEGSTGAKRSASVILEALSGLRSTTEASEAMEISLSRYYVLETRALQGLITALEPRPKGRQKSPEDDIKRLEREKNRIEREMLRYQSLVRVAQRSIGIEAPGNGKGKSEGGRKVMRKRKPRVRSRQIVSVLREQAEESVGA